MSVSHDWPITEHTFGGCGWAVEKGLVYSVLTGGGSGGSDIHVTLQLVTRGLDHTDKNNMKTEKQGEAQRDK